MAEDPKNLNSDELLIRNTYLNATGNLPPAKNIQKRKFGKTN